MRPCCLEYCPCLRAHLQAWAHPAAGGPHSVNEAEAAEEEQSFLRWVGPARETTSVEVPPAAEAAEEPTEEASEVGEPLGLKKRRVR